MERRRGSGAAGGGDGGGERGLVREAVLGDRRAVAASLTSATGGITRACLLFAGLLLAADVRKMFGERLSWFAEPSVGDRLEARDSANSTPAGNMREDRRGDKSSIR